MLLAKSYKSGFPNCCCNDAVRGVRSAAAAAAAAAEAAEAAAVFVLAMGVDVDLDALGEVEFPLADFTEDAGFLIPVLYAFPAKVDDL